MSSPNVPSSSSRSKVEGISKSLEELALDPYDGKFFSNFNSLRFPGTLEVLPMEIMWMVLDNVLMGDGPLTHSAICTIRKLSYATNKVVSTQMSDYLQTRES